MAGAGDRKGTGEEDKGKAIQSADIDTTCCEPVKKRKQSEPAASTKVAGCTREPAASAADIAGAGDLKGKGTGTGEEDAIQSPDISTTLEPEKKREREVAAQLAEQEEELQRKLTEERVAVRYTIPVEVFSAGSSSSGCALVGSIKGFQQAAADTHRPFFVMPYLPPRDAVDIQSEMEGRWLRPQLMNPDVLATKVAVMKEIDSETRKAAQSALLSQEDLASPNPEEKEKQLFRFRIASDLVRFRIHMHNRLLFAYAAKGTGIFNSIQFWLNSIGWFNSG